MRRPTERWLSISLHLKGKLTRANLRQSSCRCVARTTKDFKPYWHLLRNAHDQAVHRSVVPSKRGQLVRSSSRNREVRLRIPGIAPKAGCPKWLLIKVFAQVVF